MLKELFSNEMDLENEMKELDRACDKENEPLDLTRKYA